MRKQKQKIVIAVIIVALVVIIATISTIFVFNAKNKENNKTSKKSIEEDPDSMEATYKNFEDAKEDILNSKDEQILIYQKEDEYIFINQEGEEISRQKYDEVSPSTISVEIKGKIKEIRPVKKDNKYFFINAAGEKMFDVEEDRFEGTSDVWANFSSYIYQKGEKADIEVEKDEKDNKLEKELYLDEKTFPNDKNKKKYIEFEEKEENEEREIMGYYYFKNEEITDKVLQVIIFDKETDDTELEKIWKEKEDSEINSTFYGYERDYYLINTKTKEKIKLDCNNLLFSYDYNAEDDYFNDKIMLYSDGSIPYYDQNLTGYFDVNTGEKKCVDNNLIIIDVDENYQYIYDKETKSSLVRNKETEENEKIYEKAFISIFKNFCKLEGKDTTTITDKELNEVFESNEGIYIKVYGNIILVSEDGGEEEMCLYKIDDNKLLEIDQPSSSNILYPIYLTENEEDCEQQSVYIKTGVIDELL